MWRRVGLVGTYVSEELVALYSSETSVRTRPTRRQIPKDDILHNNRSKNCPQFDVISSFQCSKIFIGAFFNKLGYRVLAD
jgi:hypothetical protein